MSRSSKRRKKKQDHASAGSSPGEGASSPGGSASPPAAAAGPRGGPPLRALAVLGVALVAAGVAVGAAALLRLGPFGEPRYDLETATDRMLASEELYLHAARRLRQLGKSIENLELPDFRSRDLFAERVRANDLADGPPRDYETEYASVGIGVRHWPVSEEAPPVAGSELRLWQPLVERVEYFEHAKFYIIDARFTDEPMDTWWTQMGFDGLARTKEGRWAAFKGKLEAVWERNPAYGDSLDAYRIREWTLHDFASVEADGFLFEEVLDRALPDPSDRFRARTSIHELLVAQFLLDLSRPVEERSFAMPTKYFRPPAQDRHPGLAVVDIDRDGFDDLYVMDQWGRNMLFRNRGDGTFEDVAPRWGLDLKDHCSSAIFADFDNDGDDDLFLGRTLERSRYLENVGGRFVDRSDRVDVPLPYLVSAVTAADYDGDGLLDLYLSTYAADAMRTDLTELRQAGRLTEALGDRQTTQLPPMKSPLADFLSADDTRRLHELRTDERHGYHGYRNAYGPPNLVLRNTGGGRFVEDTRAAALRVFRHTYQATWGDWDGDGDPDLYLANDFAPNHMFRNDGEGRFADVTEETRTADIGFGMGVSWGDYDRDGDQDLYVSNMFSKAGKRITKQVPGLDPIFAAMARGNSLFSNDEVRFEKVSGMDPPAVQVEVAGWSWGSQFADLDNDGWLDIHALAGHYTAPRTVESQVDI